VKRVPSEIGADVVKLIVDEVRPVDYMLPFSLAVFTVGVGPEERGQIKAEVVEVAEKDEQIFLAGEHVEEQDEQEGQAGEQEQEGAVRRGMLALGHVGGSGSVGSWEVEGCEGFRIVLGQGRKTLCI
jgi:hypothetical protein